MKICVVGLGLMGGSFSLALRGAGYTVFGYDKNQLTRTYALNNGVVEGISDEFSSFDLVIVALPYEDTVSFLENTAFKEGAFVADICGVKGAIEAVICRNERNFKYVGCHPMAGKERSGIEHASADLFNGANMIITVNQSTDKAALEAFENLFRKIGFGKIVKCSADCHDKKIAYTSQLAHVVSNAYVKDPEIENCLYFTGGSFQDMTRIAGVDEKVWSSLYLANRENLSQKIGSLIESLQELKDAVDSGDKKRLERVLLEGKRVFESDKNKWE